MKKPRNLKYLRFYCYQHGWSVYNCPGVEEEPWDDSYGLNYLRVMHTWLGRVIAYIEWKQARMKK